MKTYNLFPNYVFEGKLEITNENFQLIKKDLNDISNSGFVIDTNFGWITNKKKGLPYNSFKSMGLLMGNIFGDAIRKNFNLNEYNIDVIEPYLISIKPEHEFPINTERSRWYNGCVWLQTSNKGSNLILEDFSSRRYIGPPTIQHTKVIPSAKNKVVFWPSDIPWGMTPNVSYTDSICLIVTFLAPNINKKTNG